MHFYEAIIREVLSEHLSDSILVSAALGEMQGFFARLASPVSRSQILTGTVPREFLL